MQNRRVSIPFFTPLCVYIHIYLISQKSEQNNIQCYKKEQYIFYLRMPDEEEMGKKQTMMDHTYSAPEQSI